MMASIPQSFAHPGAMPGHGMPHHPMGPGHPQNQAMAAGQPGVSMAQAMHAMGGAPQMNQAGPMMNMHQGGGPQMGVGPNAHAMSHLNPNTNPAVFATQQQQIAAAIQNNPQLLQQQMAQRQAMQQQQIMMQRAAAQTHGGMVMNPNAPNAMAAMNMRNAQGVPLPAHLQQQMQQQQQNQAQAQLAFQAQQQQQAQQQHQQQLAQQLMANGGVQPGATPVQAPTPQPMRPPSQIGVPDQQAMAVAHAQAQAQQVNQQQNQQQAQQQAQQQNQQAHPQHPQQAVAQQQAAQQQQQQQQQQAAAQQQQQQQQQNQQAAAQQAAAQQQNPPQTNHVANTQAAQAQNAQQQAQAANQAQQQQQAAQGQQPGQAAQPDMAVQTQRQQAAQLQANQQQMLMRQMQQQQQQPTKGISVMKLLHFGDQLSSVDAQQQSGNINWWRSFVSRYFSETGIFRQTLYNSGDSGSKTWELSTPCLPRYYWTQYTSGVQSIQLVMENANEKEIPGGGTFVDCPKASFIYWLSNGNQVVTTGVFRAHFNSFGKLDTLEHNITEHNEYISRTKLAATPESPETKPSPNLTKGANKKGTAAQQKLQRQMQISDTRISLPKPTVNDWGLLQPVQKLLEIAETFSHMENLFQFAKQNPNLSAPEALRQLVSSYQNAPQNPNMPNDPNAPMNPGMMQQPPGQRTPNAQFPNGQQQFNSPAPGAHLNLPQTASPANMSMSPAMQAQRLQGQGGQPMVAQASAQGSATGSQGTSANTSPNVTNKRRRPSGVKTEMDGDEPAVKVKQSPRPNPKRQKA